MRPAAEVRLQEITAATLDPVLDLTVGPDQDGLVAENAVSIAQAHFQPAAWFRAVMSGDETAGFVMLHDPTLPGAAPKREWGPHTVVLWRFMIDHRFQGRGIGRAAIDLVTEHVRGRPGVTRFVTTYIARPGGPAGFYHRLGFTDTGRDLDGETEALRPL